jgi:hypothetical protein
LARADNGSYRPTSDQQRERWEEAVCNRLPFRIMR